MEDSGRLGHGELETELGGLTMVATPSPDYQGPRRHRETCESPRKWHEAPWVVDGVLVYVADVDEHCRRAREAGATILTEIEEGGPGRRYRAEDPEGHRWMFMESGG